jgi:hypothetical protein
MMFGRLALHTMNGWKGRGITVYAGFIGGLIGFALFWKERASTDFIRLVCFHFGLLLSVVQLYRLGIMTVVFCMNCKRRGFSGVPLNAILFP